MFESFFKILSSNDARSVFHVFSKKWVRPSIAISLLLYAYGVFKNTATFIAKGEYVSVVTYYIDSDLDTKNRQTTYLLRSTYIRSLSDQKIDKRLANVEYKEINKAFYIPFFLMYCIDTGNKNVFTKDLISMRNIEELDRNLSQAQTSKFCAFTQNNYTDEDAKDYVENFHYDWKFWLIPKYASKHIVDTIFCGSYGLLTDLHVIDRRYTFERDHSCNII